MVVFMIFLSMISSPKTMSAPYLLLNLSNIFDIFVINANIVFVLMFLVLQSQWQRWSSHHGCKNDLIPKIWFWGRIVLYLINLSDALIEINGLVGEYILIVFCNIFHRKDSNKNSSFVFSKTSHNFFFIFFYLLFTSQKFLCFFLSEERIKVFKMKGKLWKVFAFNL